MKVPNPPGSGKDIAEGKGVCREAESEGSRMFGKKLTEWANLRSDEQKPYKRLRMRTRLQYKSKSDNYPESCVIDMADRWRERTCEYPGRSAWKAVKAVSTAESSVEHAEVSRGHSSGDTKDRISRSLKYDPERRDEQWMQKTKEKAAHKEIVRNTKGM